MDPHDEPMPMADPPGSEIELDPPGESELVEHDETGVESGPVPTFEDVVPATAAAPVSEVPEAMRLLTWDASVGPTPLGLGWESEPVLVDWQGRGPFDLLVSAGGGPDGRRFVTLYAPVAPPTPGQAPVYDQGTRVAGLEGLRALCPIPDGNGPSSRFDLVALEDDGTLVLVRNTGSPGRPEFGAREPMGLTESTLGLGAGRIAQMIAVDWDGDGLTDLLLGFESLDGYWPDGPEIPIAQQVGFNQMGGHPGYNRSGQWRGKPARGRIAWMRNVGRPGAPRFAPSEEIHSDDGPLELAVRPAPLAVAWGGKGSLELLLTDARGDIKIYRNFGGQRPPVLMEPRTVQTAGDRRRPLALPDDRTVLIAGDLDGDRRVELLLGSSDGRVFAVHGGVHRDEAHPPVPIRHESPEVRLGGQTVIEVADVDGDGDLDLIVGDPAGRLHWVRDDGTPGRPRYALPREIDAGGAPYRLDPGPDGRLGGPAAPTLGYACPALVDWTANGRLDLLVGGAGGELWLFRNNGASNDPRFDLPKLLRCNGAPLIGPPRVKPAAVDWNGTGQADIVALDLQGFLCVYPRTGPFETSTPIPLTDRLGRLIRLDGGFGRAGRISLWVGPWTAPGRLDVLIGLPRGHRHVIPPLTGLPLESVDALPTVLLLEHTGRGMVIARPLTTADDQPLIVGAEGCSPCGVPAPDGGLPDLVVGSDDGRVHFFRREALRW